MAEYISKEAVLKHLNECKEDPLFDPDMARICFAISIFIEELQAADVQPVDRWISCQDKMPEEYKTVLVYEKDYGVMIGELEKKIFDTQYFIVRKSGLILRTTEVTHWQPLPEPPKDGDIE